jgi:hypothetical protein
MTNRIEAAKALVAADSEIIFCRGGRSSRKLHTAYRGGFTTFCGHRMKSSSDALRMTAYDVKETNLCERCCPERG